MTTQERERLAASAAMALVIHALLLVAFALSGWRVEPYPETTPVYVTLPDYARPEPVPEPTPPAPVEPTPQPPPPVEPTPTPPQAPTPTPTPTPSPAPTPTPPTQPRTTPPSTTAAPAAPRSTDAPPGELSSRVDMPWLTDEGADREALRPQGDDLFAQRAEAERPADVPDWVVAGEFSMQPLDTLSAADRSGLQARLESVPGFADAFAAYERAITSGPTAGTTPGSPTSGPGTPGTDPGVTALPGGGLIDWLGQGGRPLLPGYAMPALTAADFYGSVPARVSYLFSIDVNAEGFVVPGSLILRQSSGYTLADDKVRRAVSSWRFETVQGSGIVTGIATLHIERGTIR